MSKSLKEIVEDGFARLDLLSEKRKEILSRCDELAEGVTSGKCRLSLSKLEATENAHSTEIALYVERSQEALALTLSKIVEENEFFLGSVKENLQLRMARVLNELSTTRELLLAGSSEKFDSSLRKLEREIGDHGTDLRAETVKKMGELKNSLKTEQSSLHEAQTGVSGRLSASEQELVGSLGSQFTSLAQEFENHRQQVGTSLEKLYSELSSKVIVRTEEIDECISPVLTQQRDTVDSLSKETEESFQQATEQVLLSSASEIITLSQVLFSDLETSCRVSHQELSSKLSELQTYTDQYLNQYNESVLKLELGLKSKTDSHVDELKTHSMSQSSRVSITRGPIDETLRQLSSELDLRSSDLKRQLSELLKAQQERLSKLCTVAEGSLLASATALNSELKQMMKLHEQSWSERERGLLSRIRSIEMAAQKVYASIADSASIDDSAGAAADEGV